MTRAPRTAAHILSFARDFQGGGVERALLRLAGGWVEAGRRVTLVVGEVTGPLVAEIPSTVELIEIGIPTRRALAAALPGLVRARVPHVIFCPGNFYTATAALMRLRLGGECPPVVGQMSNTPERHDLGRVGSLANRWWMARHHRFLNHLVAMTPATGEAAARALGMVGRTSVIANPPARSIAGAVVPPLPGGRFILGVGRLVPQKRWDRLIAAVPALTDASIKVVILGEGPLRTALTTQIEALGLEERVSLPGNVADPLPAMARAAVMVLVSDFEGVPGVISEALGVGTPVVATDSSIAVRELIHSDRLGTVVSRHDPAALVAALDRWLAADARRPAPVPPPGSDAAARYLALFDRLVSQA